MKCGVPGQPATPLCVGSTACGVLLPAETPVLRAFGRCSTFAHFRMKPSAASWTNPSISSTSMPGTITRCVWGWARFHALRGGGRVKLFFRGEAVVQEQCVHSLALTFSERAGLDSSPFLSPLSVALDNRSLLISIPASKIFFIIHHASSNAFARVLAENIIHVCLS